MYASCKQPEQGLCQAFDVQVHVGHPPVSSSVGAVGLFTQTACHSPQEKSLEMFLSPKGSTETFNISENDWKP